MLYKDTLLFEKEHDENARRIVDLFLEDTVHENDDQCYCGILCIAGTSGCGKTETAIIASDLLYRCGLTTHIIHLDKYYIVPPDQREAHRKQTMVIGRDEMDWDAIDAEIDFFSNHKVKVLIVEGLYSAWIDGHRFFIEATIEGTEDFKIRRGKENELDEWRQFVVGEEFKAVQASKYMCQHII